MCPTYERMFEVKFQHSMEERDVDLLELEPIGLHDRSEVFEVINVRELVDHADSIL